MKKKVFTLIEMLTVILLIGIVLVIAIPAVKKLTYNSTEKKYKQLEKVVLEASKSYTNNYHEEIVDIDKECFSIPYENLINESLIEEEDITCSGYVVATRQEKREYDYEPYLTCKDKNGKVIHDDQALNLGESYAILNGYHDAEKVAVSPLASDTSATSTAADILKDKTAWVNGNLLIGTMPDNGGINQELNPGESYTIPEGYHDGTGKITTSSLASNTLATSTASNILKDKTAWVNGKLLTGTMANYSNQHIWINEGNGTFYDNIEYTYSSGDTTNEMVGFKSNKTGYFDTSTLWLFGKKSDLAKMIKSGTTFLGVAGTYTSDATATSADILEGKTAYVNGTKIIGTMPKRAASSNAESVTASNGIINVRILTGAYIATTTTAGAPEILFNASEIGLTADKILAGQSVAGINGKATSDANVTAADIVSGKTAYVNGSKVAGTMVNNGAVSKTGLTVGSTYTIPKGYHNGSGKVTAATLESQTSATATAGNILKDKTAWVNGSKLTGTMANNGAINKKLVAGGSYTVPAGYTSGGSVSVTHVIKSWTPNYGQWVSSSSMTTKDTYSVNATSLYVLATAENGGTVSQNAAASCSDGTIKLMVNSSNVVLYKIEKTESATFTLNLLIKRSYSTYPDSTLRVYAFTAN